MAGSSAALTLGMGVGYPDMVAMDALTPQSILDNVQRRYLQDAIYTHVSSILIAVNPYHPLPSLYDSTALSAFHHLPPSSSPPPHIYSIARAAYLRALGVDCPAGPASQSILISGESGAGKTEATKQILAYLAYASSCTSRPPHLPTASASRTSSASTLSSHMAAAITASVTHHVEQRLLQANPILEAFGNAKTLRNDNSSRFGKYVSVHLSPDGRIVGGSVQSYLLETSRVVRQGAGERNYNIFYHLLASRRMDPSHFRYLNHSGCVAIDGMDETAMYDGVQQALTVIGVPASHQQQIMDIVLGILHMGNCAFIPAGKDGCEVADESADELASAARLLGLAENQLRAGLTTKVIVSPRSTIINMPRTVKEAEETRDSMAKLLYSHLMSHLITRINRALTSPASPSAPSSSPLSSPPVLTIGILDIFGFECFPCNSLEQLLINYANERLHQHFLSYVFKAERQLYQAEGLTLPSQVTFQDNQPTLDLLDKKPQGVLPLLHDELFIPKGSDANLLAKVHTAHSASPVYFKPRVNSADRFGVQHYAGLVEYTAAGMLDKNRSKVGEQLLSLFEGATTDVMREMFGVDDEPDDTTQPTPPPPAAGAKGKWEAKASVSVPGPVGASPPVSRPGSASSVSAGSRVSVSSLFTQSLADLLASIGATHSHFVRCIKPNGEKRRGAVDGELLLGQLTSSGVIDAVRVRKDGYSERMLTAAFLRTYLPLVARTLTQRAMHKAADRAKVALIMEAVAAQPLTQWQQGRERVFYKAGVHTALEAQRRTQLGWAAVLIQKRVRGWLVRRRQRAVQRLLRDVTAALHSGHLGAVDACLVKGKEAGVALPAPLLAGLQKQRGLLSQGDKAALALAQALTLPTSSLRDRLGLLTAASALLPSLGRPPHPTWWPSLPGLQQAVTAATSALQQLTAAMAALGDGVGAGAQLDALLVSTTAALKAAISPTLLDPASLCALSGLTEVSGVQARVSRSQRVATGVKAAMEARDASALRRALEEGDGAGLTGPVMADGRLCHQALVLAEAVDTALEQWTEPALVAIINQVRSLLPKGGPGGALGGSPLDAHLPAGVSVASLLALLEASVVALASELEASQAAQRALTMGDHFKLTMAIQRAEDALYMKQHSRRKVQGGAYAPPPVVPPTPGAKKGLEELVTDMKREMTKLEALALQGKERDARQARATDGLKAAMASANAPAIEAAIQAAEDAGLPEQQVAHARAHQLTVETCALLARAIDDRAEAGLKAALEVSAQRLKAQALDVRSREYQDRHQQAKATLDQVVAIRRVHEVEAAVNAARLAREQRAGQRAGGGTVEEEAKEENEWTSTVDGLRDAIAAARLHGARDTDIHSALEIVHAYDALRPGREGEGVEGAQAAVEAERVREEEEAEAKEKERILAKLRPQLNGGMRVILPQGTPPRRPSEVSADSRRASAIMRTPVSNEADARAVAEGIERQRLAEQAKQREVVREVAQQEQAVKKGGKKGPSPPKVPPPLKGPLGPMGPGLGPVLGPVGGAVEYAYEVGSPKEGEEEDDAVKAAIEAALKSQGGEVGPGQVVPLASSRALSSSTSLSPRHSRASSSAVEKEGMARVLRVSQAEWSFDVEAFEKSQLRPMSLGMALQAEGLDRRPTQELPPRERVRDGEIIAPRHKQKQSACACCCVIS